MNEVTERMRQLIRSGELAAGSRLHQERLAESLGVSRTPVREALLRLEQEDLIVVDPGRGRFVRQASVAEVRQVAEMRAILEPAAVRLACERATADERALANDAHGRHKLVSFADGAQISAASTEMHRLLTQPSRNPLLMDTLETLWAHTENLQQFVTQVPNAQRARELLEEHEPIVQAFVRGSASRAEKLMREHVRKWSVDAP